MKMEKLFTMIDGVFTRDMKGTVSEFVQDLIHAENIPPSQVEYTLDHLFLLWIGLEKTMITEMLSTAMHMITVTDKDDNDDTKA